MKREETMDNSPPNSPTETGKSEKRTLSRRTVLKGAAAGAAGAALAYGIGKLGFTGRTPSRPPESDPSRMVYRANPNSGDKVSLLGFGCMRFPLLPEATSPRGPEIDEAAAIRLVDHAIRHGVNYFDTAYRYHGGMSEVVIGKALKPYPRDSFYLADKMPTALKPTLEDAKQIFQTQLDRCQVDYFDYYLLHGVSSLALYTLVYETNGVLDYLLELKKEGRIRNLGWSFHGDKELLEHIISREVHWDFAMLQLNYHDLLFEYVPQKFVLSNLTGEPPSAQWLLDKMSPLGTPIMVMEPLLGGRLARLNKKALTILQEENPEDSAAAWAMRFAAGIPKVLCVLSGMTYMEHLQDNLRTYSPLHPLSEREMGALQRALDIFITQENIPCTGCGYCMPCPYGVEISSVFTHYNYCVDDEYIPKGVRNADYERARRAFLVGHDRSIPELRQASRCTGCNLCTPHCPQFINIPEQMARLGHFVEQLRKGA